MNTIGIQNVCKYIMCMGLERKFVLYSRTIDVAYTIHTYVCICFHVEIPYMNGYLYITLHAM